MRWAWRRPIVHGYLTERYSDWRFEQHLGEYEKILTDLNGPQIAEGANFVDVHSIREAPAGVVMIKAAHCTKTAVVVKFVTSVSGRVEKGYLFKGCDDTTAIYGPGGVEHQYYLRHITGNWYRFIN